MATTSTTRRVRVQNLQAGDVVHRDAFGSKVVAGLRRYIKRGRPDARIVKYEDGTASLFKANRLVDVVTVTEQAERVVEPYSVLYATYRSGDAPVSA